MARSVRVTLLGKGFTLQTEEDEAHVQRVAGLVDDRLRDLQGRTSLPVQSVALLAALTLADELEKERSRNAELRGELRGRVQRLRERLIEAAGER